MRGRHATAPPPGRAREAGLPFRGPILEGLPSSSAVPQRSALSAGYGT